LYLCVIQPLTLNLISFQVKKIPKEFFSTAHYANSFVFPLIEETHADLCSSLTMVSKASAVEILAISISKDYNPPYDLLYNIKMQKLGDSENDREMYEPYTGDLIALTDIRPTCIDDLIRQRSYLIALVRKARKNIRDESFDEIQVLSSKPIEFEQNMQKNKKRTIRFAVFLINMATNIRIWKALTSGEGGKNMNIIKKVLQADSTVRT
jgi:senataxin